MKILLIEPPFYRLYKDSYSLSVHPLSLAYLAGAVKKYTEWDVVTYNSDFNPTSEPMQTSYLVGEGFDSYKQNLTQACSPVWGEVEKAIREIKPDVLAITSKSQNFRSACMVAEKAKEIDSDIEVIIGGPHSTMVGADVFECAALDACVVGEGEMTLVEYLQVRERGKPLNDVAGLIFRKGDEIVNNGRREYIEDLDEMMFPHEVIDGILYESEKYPKEAFANVFSSRGCPQNCFFCGSRNIWSRKVRYRSVDDVIREIKGLKAMGLNTVNFEDDMFGINRDRILELCARIKEECSPLSWHCEMHIRLISDEVVRALKDAGCRSIQVGIESGNNDMLKRIRKNFEIEKAYEACRIIRRHGINLQTFFMIGFPEETEETIRDTVDAMYKVKSDSVICSIFTPYPATEAFEFCRENGLIGDDYDVSLHNHQSPENCFCLNIEKIRFREVVSEVASAVDRINKRARYRNIFSSRIFSKLKDHGFKGSLLRAKDIIGHG